MGGQQLGQYRWLWQLCSAALKDAMVDSEPGSSLSCRGLGLVFDSKPRYLRKLTASVLCLTLLRVVEASQKIFGALFLWSVG